MNYIIKGGFVALGDYLSEHVLWCLIPAFFIAGAIASFVKKDAIMKYFGPNTPKKLSYPLASVSGAILAVCSCTVIPLFVGIKRRGAGIGPATAFLFSGPAINILAIVYTARVLGFEIGFARAVFAITMALVLGTLMALIFTSDDKKNQTTKKKVRYLTENTNNSYRVPIFMIILVIILVLGGVSVSNFEKLLILSVPILILIIWTKKCFEDAEIKDWLKETYKIAKMIIPLLLIGVFITGMIGEILTEEQVSKVVGSNSIYHVFIASVIGALMYIATLTEVPIVETLMGLGMESGPAMALLLAGPALSLPNMLAIRRAMGTKKTFTYILLVIAIATLCGIIYGNILT